MQRRTFFKFLASNLTIALLPKWSRAQLAAAGPGASIQDIALVVLPASLGPKRIGEVTVAFETWLRDYKAGVDAGYGYGFTRLTVTAPNPSQHYSDQLKQLDAAASAKGGSFATLSLADKRAILQAALLAAGATSIPTRPNGKHVAADLMGYFYSSSDGIDFCYNAAIRIADCRGLVSSAKRPDPLT
jgi:tRNA U34 5-methylaminomethyl-2-thiouridine-forming methyltransferase MnmC